MTALMPVPETTGAGGTGEPRVEVLWAAGVWPPSNLSTGGAVPADTPEEVMVRLERFGRRVLEQLRFPAEVSVLLCDGTAIRDLNSRYRGVDAPTDVLSFGQLEGTTVPATGAAQHAGADASSAGAPDAAGIVAGDVVIAVDVAARQAAARGEPFARELCRLLVHGMLHLAGMDHADPPADDEPMLSLQEQMLADFPLYLGTLRHALVED